MLREDTLLMIEEKALAEGKMLVEAMDDLQLESYVDNLLVWIKERENKSFDNEHMDNHNIKMINHYRKEFKYIQDHFKKDTIEEFFKENIKGAGDEVRINERIRLIDAIETRAGEGCSIDLEISEDKKEMNGIARGKKGLFFVRVDVHDKTIGETFNYVANIEKM